MVCLRPPAIDRDLDHSRSPEAGLLIPPPYVHLQKQPARPGAGLGEALPPRTEDQRGRELAALQPQDSGCKNAAGLFLNLC